jgi:hypothetical protein
MAVRWIEGLHQQGLTQEIRNWEGAGYGTQQLAPAQAFSVSSVLRNVIKSLA